LNPLDRLPFKEHIEEENEIAEYIFGRVARRDGEEFDTTKTLAWQRGWAEAQGAEAQG
jgi:hypothetical protein